MNVRRLLTTRGWSTVAWEEDGVDFGIHRVTLSPAETARFDEEWRHAFAMMDPAPPLPGVPTLDLMERDYTL
jgi:hypothetical protein